MASTKPRKSKNSTENCGLSEDDKLSEKDEEILSLRAQIAENHDQIAERDEKIEEKML